MRGRLPDRHELANIVYRSSFGLRAEAHSELSSERIRESRYATAIVVCNRARQNITWGASAGTESEAAISDASRAQRGNGRAYQECFDMAVAALQVHGTHLPLDCAMFLGGAQFYRHNDHHSYRRWDKFDADLVRAIGPMSDVAGHQFWLGVYLNPRYLERAIAAQTSGAAVGQHA
jgi:hypothetical protein